MVEKLKKKLKELEKKLLSLDNDIDSEPSHKKRVKAEIDKVKKEIAKPVQEYYDIKVEAKLPATLSYRVLANSPEDAIEKCKKLTPNDVKYKLVNKKELKIVVYLAGSTIIKLIKNCV